MKLVPSHTFFHSRPMHLEPISTEYYQHPFRQGYIDEVNLIFAKASEAGSTAILATNLDPLGTTGAGLTLATGITIDLPTTGSTGSVNTKLLVKGDGIHDCKRFVENGLNISDAMVQSYDPDRRILLIANYGYTGSATGFNPVKGYI